MNQNTEEYAPLIPIGVSLRCGECGGGHLEAINDQAAQSVYFSNTVATFPPPPQKFEHVCTNPKCNNRVYLEDIYPRIEYDDLESYLESTA